MAREKPGTLRFFCNVGIWRGVVQVSEERALWLARHILPHEPALRAQLARWRVPDGLEADDVVQEAYSRLAAMESVAYIRDPKTYLFSIARTTILMHLRHSRVVSIRGVDNLDQFDLAVDEPTPEDHVSDRQQLHLLAVAVAELPEPSRRAFLMRVIDELPHREIGRRLGLSDNAVQKSIAKSLVLLTHRLGRGGKGMDEASSPRREKKAPARHDQARDERRD